MQYRSILALGYIECPPPDKNNRNKGLRDRLKRPKSRALQERLIAYQEVLFKKQLPEVFNIGGELLQKKLNLTACYLLLNILTYL